jgi:hypothetical protein
LKLSHSEASFKVKKFYKDWGLVRAVSALGTEVLSIPDKRIIKTQIHRYEKWCGVPRGVFTGNFDSTTNFGLTTKVFYTINFAADATTSWYDNLESFCPARHPDRCCDE